MKHSSIALALASILALTALVGCEDKASVNEAYKGVPTNGQSCKEFYQLPANQVKCTNTESRH